MDWLAPDPLLWAAALAASLVLAVINWRLMSGGPEIPAGLGRPRVHSRVKIAVAPALLIGLAGLASLAALGAPSTSVRVLEGLWIVSGLGTQGFMIAAAARRRRERKVRSKDLFGE